MTEQSATKLPPYVIAASYGIAASYVIAALYVIPSVSRDSYPALVVEG
jgi:hypothetical protein